MKLTFKNLIIISSMVIIGNTAFAQYNPKKDTVKVVTAEKKPVVTNVMLNASNDNGPRNVNIGLPASIGGTTILENGLPVVYSFFGQGPTRLWRSSNSFSKFSVQSVAETAISIGDVGVSLSTYSNKGTKKFQGAATVQSNSFGLLRADISMSGPLKNGFYYAVSANVNFDPGTFKPDFARYLDQTQIYKGVINKKYNGGKGEIGIQYKFADSKAIGSKQSPYVYKEDGTVSQFGDFRIGRDSYLERTGKSHIINPLTGKAEEWDQLKDMGSTSHVIDLLGSNKFDNGLKFNYIVRYNHAKSGLYNPYYTGLSQYDKTTTRYVYPDDQTKIYNGDYVQSVLVLANPKNKINTVMARFDLGKKSGIHDWNIGLNQWYYNVKDFITASALMYQEANADPYQLIKEEYKNGTWNRGDANEYGNVAFNRAMQYYSGWENKLALYFTDKWTLAKRFDFTVGARLEWQRIDGLWYPKENRKNAPDQKWISGEKASVKKDWFNKAFTFNFLYKTFENSRLNFGFLADASYTEVAGNLSSYSGPDDPMIDPSQIPAGSIGAYFNHSMISIVSKATFIKRNNFKNNSTFAYGYKQTITYDIQTFGWTTDLVFTPFKGFKLHCLLTLQKPEYKNFIIDLRGVPGEDQLYDLSGGIARSVSKTIVEIDPSYTYKSFNIWASARYFSREAANYPNTLFFASRWETFAGVKYKLNKNVDLNVNVVNVLNQKGAQGSISGTNTTTAEQAPKFYNKPLTGSYIRPFTVEFGVRVKF